MADRRAHRGAHPEDSRLFAHAAWPTLRSAVTDLSWLLSREYPGESALKLVGDRYRLEARQRIAVARSACSQQSLTGRLSRRVPADRLADGEVWIDGYNVLTTIEAALAGGVILGAMDGAYRDMASMHGSYRKVEETEPALELLGDATTRLKACRWVWLLDRPVSNSGRLKQIMDRLARERGWAWEVRLVPDPDPVLATAPAVVVTADSAILDRCSAWYNLAAEVVQRAIADAHVVRLGPEA